MLDGECAHLHLSCVHLLDELVFLGHVNTPPISSGQLHIQFHSMSNYSSASLSIPELRVLLY